MKITLAVDVDGDSAVLPPAVVESDTLEKGVAMASSLMLSYFHSFPHSFPPDKRPGANKP